MTSFNRTRGAALFSRTLILTALFVVAAAGSLLCARSARADAPEVQNAAQLLVAQSMGNPAMGVTAMQILWGGSKGDEPPKGKAVQETNTSTANARKAARHMRMAATAKANGKSQ